jgi:hypothetical protein
MYNNKKIDLMWGDMDEIPGLALNKLFSWTTCKFT